MIVTKQCSKVDDFEMWWIGDLRFHRGVSNRVIVLVADAIHKHCDVTLRFHKCGKLRMLVMTTDHAQVRLIVILLFHLYTFMKLVRVRITLPI